MNNDARWINGWSYRSSLTYPDFLQAKEFETSYRYAIDEQTSALIANERDLAEANMAVIREQNTLLAQIDSTMARGLNEINGTFNWGFTEVIAGIGRLNDQLSDLVRIARTPAQTWAYEQYDIARDALRKGLFLESLRYLDRAINGAAGNAGYDIDFRFHFLKGVIQLGSEKNTDPELVKLPEAEASFLLAARYSRTDYPQDSALALLFAGRAALCSRQLERALQHTDRCLLLAPSLIAEACFQKAKILCATNSRLDVAASSVVSAIRLDKHYGLKIGSDGDLIPHESMLMEAFDEERRLLECEVIAEENQIAQCLAKRRGARVCGVAYAEVEKSALVSCEQLLMQIQGRRAGETYFYLLNETARLATLRKMMADSLQNYPDGIRAEISRQLGTLQNVSSEIKAKGESLSNRIESLASIWSGCLVLGTGFGLTAPFMVADYARHNKMSPEVIIPVVVLGVMASIPCLLLLYLRPVVKALVRAVLHKRITENSFEQSRAEIEVEKCRLRITAVRGHMELETMDLPRSVITRRDFALTERLGVGAGAPTVGSCYEGTVTDIREFGVFVEILPGKEGLVHISELADEKVQKIEDICKLGDKILVKCLTVDESGKVRLSRKRARAAEVDTLLPEILKNIRNEVVRGVQP